MAARLPTEKLALEKSAKLPGPGNYAQMNVTGNDLTNSVYKNQSKFSFSKAQDRFTAPTKKQAPVSPSSYSPMNNLNQNFNSTFVNSGQTEIGKSTFSVIDQHFGMKKTNPGPGSYNRFSEFSGI